MMNALPNEATQDMFDLSTATPWACDAGAFRDIAEAADNAMRATGIDAIEAALRPVTRPPVAPRAAASGTAVIRVLGPIARRKSWVTELLGWTHHDGIRDQLATANADPAVSRIVFEVDSPGGVVSGVSDTADLIRRSAKPTVAFIDGMAASAAYWLASAADTIVTSKSATLGSIGIVATWRSDPNRPITIISSQSPMKNADPSTRDGRAEHQRVVDDLAAIFVSDVARYRGKTPQQVIDTFGRGGLLVGASAAAAGMADQVGSFADALSAAPTLRAGTAAKPMQSPAARMNATIEDLVQGGMDRPLAVLQAARDNPDLVAQLAPKAPPREDPRVLERYEAALARLVAAGTPAAVAPLTLARTEPDLAAAGARAAREAADNVKGIIHGY
jgi:ClpP class serine protease